MQNYTYTQAEFEKYFHGYEFVPREIYNILGEKSIYIIDSRIREVILFIRLYFNLPIIINNWYNNGNFSDRGFRVCNSSIGAKKSMHKTGGAIDFDVKNFSAPEIREILKKKYNEYPVLKNIKRIENNVNWVHIDIMDTGKNELIFFTP